MNQKQNSEMSHKSIGFQRYATEYDPIKIGSIDGTDTVPHDRALLRAMRAEHAPDPSVSGDARRTVLVARLHPNTTQETILAEFSQCGKIARCRLVKDLVTGKSRRYAFVEFHSESDVERALRRHGDYIDNAEVVVERSARLLAGWAPRRAGGGFGGCKESGQLRFGCRTRPFRIPILPAPLAHTRDRHRNDS